MRLRLSSLTERLRASLFFVPMIAVIVGIALGLTGLAIDRHLDQRTELPLGFTSTVDSARAVLSTIAGATITFAGIAFSISLLIIQLASSQYSPRVVHTLFRDPFNKRVMALVVGTFTYCVIVLRSVRSPLEDTGHPVIPNLSVAVAVVLGIVTILAIVAFINHSAHSMDVSEILERVRREAVVQIRREWSETNLGHDREEPAAAIDGPATMVRFDRSGWVQEIDADALLRCIPDASVLRLETSAGRYAIEGALLGTLTPAPADAESVERRILSCLAIGNSRTMQQDVSYGLRQLVDVALKALSPGINDPTTAQDAILHATAALTELLHRDPPPQQRSRAHDRWLLFEQQPRHDELIHLVFDETRRAAAPHPTVCIYLLEALHLLNEALTSSGLSDRSTALLEQAELIVAGSEAAGLLARDARSVRAAYADRFEDKSARA